MEFKFSAKRLTFYLAAAVIFLIAIHIMLQSVKYLTPHNQLFGLIDRFDLDNEASIPTWFSQTIILLNSFLLAVIAWEKRIGYKPFYKHWGALSIIFLYLSIDEGSMVHESLIIPVGHFIGPLPSYLYFAWVIPFFIALLIFTLVYLSFLISLSKKFRNLFMMSGLVYVLGALGFEIIGGKIISLDLPLFYYLASVCIEESLEMAGSTFFFYTLVLYIKDNFDKPILIQLKTGKKL